MEAITVIVHYHLHGHISADENTFESQSNRMAEFNNKRNYVRKNAQRLEYRSVRITIQTDRH